MITKSEKTAVIEANKTHEGDTGSPSAHRAPEGAPERQAQPSGHVQDGRQAPPSARLPRQEGHRALSCDHCKAEHPQVSSAFPKGMNV